MANSQPALTDAQRRALYHVGNQELDRIGMDLRPAIDELIELGLVGGPLGQWALTQAGRPMFERIRGVQHG